MRNPVCFILNDEILIRYCCRVDTCVNNTLPEVIVFTNSPVQQYVSITPRVLRSTLVQLHVLASIRASQQKKINDQRIYDFIFCVWWIIVRFDVL